MSSLGYILMNWTAEFARHSKEKKELKKRQKARAAETDRTASSRTLSEAISAAVQTEEQKCEECLRCGESISRLEHHLRKLDSDRQDLAGKLNQSKTTLGITLERESKLREDHERLILEEAQVRFELGQLQKDLASKLAERDEAHSERIKLMEQLLEEKGIEWARRNEELQRELRQALRSSIYDTEREAASVNTLQQEISSLHSVIEMRSLENRDLRALNNDLVCRLERQTWLESELNNARQRLEEMNVVLQNKMTSERELLELSETLQQQLVHSREELMHFRRELENRKYLYENNNNVNVNANSGNVKNRFDKSFELSDSDASASGGDLRPHRNQHQQARRTSSGSDAPTAAAADPGLILNVREKVESVAWMLHMPGKEKHDKTNRERR